MKNNILILILSLTVFGCANKSADLVTPPITYQQENITGGNLTFEFNPKVDILFVIDNSGSMKNQLEKLKKASGEFIESFGENSLIDYRLGVISVYDSRHCDRGELYKGQQITCFPQGKLKSPFVSRGPESKKLIFDALNIGTLDPDQGGPIIEEVFSPVLTALTPEMNHENGDFIRPDSHVVIVALTDEDDSSTQYSVDDFVILLNQMLGADRVSLYGVGTVKRADGNICPRPPQRPNGPVRLAEAVKQKNGKMFSLCDKSFGKSLATIGADIRKRSLRQEIHLLTRPESGTIKLAYGKTEIPQGKGWYYNPMTQSIQIDDGLDIIFDPKARFEVTYTKISDESVKRGKVHFRR